MYEIQFATSGVNTEGGKIWLGAHCKHPTLYMYLNIKLMALSVTVLMWLLVGVGRGANLPHFFYKKVNNQNEYCGLIK